MLRQDRQVLFASQLQKAIDEIDVSEAIRFLKALPGGSSRAKYLLAMDIVRQFGNVELTIDQLKDISKILTSLLSSLTEKEVLPEYPGIPGCNIFHVLAFYTQTNSQNAEAFFTAVRNVSGLASKTSLRANPFGSTPLHIAAECNNRPIAEFIVLRDESQLLFATREGLTASEIAVQAGNTSIGKFLKDRECSLIRKRHLQSARASLNETHIVAVSNDDPELSAVETMLQILKNSKGPKPTDPRLGKCSDDESMEPRHEASVESIQSSAVSESDTVIEDALPVDHHSTSELNELAKYLKDICAPLPHGIFMAEQYREFLVRMGITRIDQVKQSMQFPVFSRKFPSFIQ